MCLTSCQSDSANHHPIARVVGSLDDNSVAGFPVIFKAITPAPGQPQPGGCTWVALIVVEAPSAFSPKSRSTFLGWRSEPHSERLPQIRMRVG